MFISGAGRGVGTDIAKAALATGHAVVATGPQPRHRQQSFINHSVKGATSL